MLVGVMLAQELLARDDPIKDVGCAVLLLELVLVLQGRSERTISHLSC